MYYVEPKRRLTGVLYWFLWCHTSMLATRYPTPCISGPPCSTQASLLSPLAFDWATTFVLHPSQCESIQERMCETLLELGLRSHMMLAAVLAAAATSTCPCLSNVSAVVGALRLPLGGVNGYVGVRTAADSATPRTSSKAPRRSRSGAPNSSTALEKLQLHSPSLFRQPQEQDDPITGTLTSPRRYQVRLVV